MKDENLKKDVSSRKKYVSTGLPVYHAKAAGIDIGDSFHEVAICDENGIFEVRRYDAFTENLMQLVTWLLSEGISTVAIESTGIYWLNLYLLLEEAGIEPYLVNAQHVKNVTGRKKDDTDAMWLQKLHSCALLNKSFQPETEIRTLRTYVRHRKNLISICSDSVRRMQKALELMNIKLHIVISDLLGKTGMSMVKAILDGERDPYKLLKYKDPRIKASDEIIIKALTGIWKDDYLFTLKQAFEEYQFYQNQIASCDEKIILCLQSQIAKVQDGDITGVSNDKKKVKKRMNFPIQLENH